MVTVHKGDDPQPWNGDARYMPGARCTHNGKTWEAGSTGIHNELIEPGGFSPFYWSEVVGDD